MADELEVSLDRLIGRQVPGTEHLQLHREKLHREANALDRILPGGFDHGARPADKTKRKPGTKAAGKKAKKSEEPKTTPEAKKKKPSKS